MIRQLQNLNTGILLTLSLLGCALLTNTVAAQSKHTAVLAAIDDAVDSQMRKQNLAGVAIAVIRDGEVAYVQSYGMANIESETPVDENTVFNWASNSKPLMAVAAMQLVQEEMLDLDVSIATYLPDVPSQWNKITTRQLLCHQSGMPHYTNGKIEAAKDAPSAEEQLDPANALRRFSETELLFEPGTKESYSSYSFVLLSAVVQAAGKQPIEEQLNQRIIKPLKMTSFQLDVAWDNQENWTTGYLQRGQTLVAIGDYAHYWKHGAGGYKSNIGDFAKFAVGLMNNQLIDGNTALQMGTLQTLPSSKVKYGLGVQVSGEGKSLKVSHGGSQDETRTRMVMYPVQRHGIVVLCNTGHADTGRISTSIYRAINGN